MQSAKCKMQNWDGSAVLSKRQYNKSVLIASFISEVKSFLDKQDEVSDVCFSPKLNGYEITYERKDISVKITSQLKIFNRLKIDKYENGVLKSSFISKNAQENKNIVQKIFA